MTHILEKKRDSPRFRVLVALSGGVDSSVAAALLLEEGHTVHGAFIKTWSVPWLPCSWREERRDAMRVAAHLHIPFHTIDLSHEYEKSVVEYLVAEYARGNTPNPDVMCNKYIKFGGLLRYALDNGYTHVATGHYAQVREVEEGSKKRYELYTGKDAQKDQTYFLWTLNQEQLSKTLFPVGGFEKSDVRVLADRFTLPTAKKKDSQGICFLGKVDMKDFLSHYLKSKKGNVLNMEGDVIGVHDGAQMYTLGQRHGFTIHKKTPTSKPYYVVERDVTKNILVVGNSDVEEGVSTSAILLQECNWISPPPKTCMARLRYRQPLFSVTLKSCTDTTCELLLDKPQPFVQRGQSVVLYQGEKCLGGGIIG